jgi:hypothetical protein
VRTSSSEDGNHERDPDARGDHGHVEREHRSHGLMLPV